jgi:hypothetical protein
VELFFFPDVYADRELVDYYIVTFELEDLSCVEIMNLDGKHYIREVLNWDLFCKSAKHIVLYELGDEIERFSDLEDALRTAYRLAYEEARRRGAKEIVPAMGVGNPPLSVINRVYPFSISLEPFPKNLDAYLEKLVRTLDIRKKTGGP